MDTTTYAAGLAGFWTAVLTWVPRFIAFLLVLLVGIAICNWIAKLVHKGSQRMALGQKLERGGITSSLERAGYGVGEVLGKIAYWACMLIVLQLAFGVFGPNPISALLTRFIAFLPNIAVALAIVVVAATIAGAVRDIARSALGGLSYGQSLATAASIAIVTIGLFAALDQLNVAPFIVNGLFYAMLAIVAGSAIVAIGGGGIQPMREVWVRTLNRAMVEAPKVRNEVQRWPASH